MPETNEARIKRLEDEVDRLHLMMKNTRKQVDGIEAQLLRMIDLVRDITRSDVHQLDVQNAIFEKAFPKNGNFLAAFNRILGREVGPEEPRRPRGASV